MPEAGGFKYSLSRPLGASPSSRRVEGGAGLDRTPGGHACGQPAQGQRVLDDRSLVDRETGHWK